MIEQYLTISDLSSRLGISIERVRQMVMHEPGVLRLAPLTKDGKAPRKVMYRIPESVAERLIRRSSNPA